jgi:UDP-glucose 4-epimerase
MIVVTGAGGFIGRYLVDELVKDGWDVLATGHSKTAERYYREKRVPFAWLDVSEQESFDHLPSGGVEGIAHLAAVLRIDADKRTPADYLMVNALGTYNVLEYSRRTGVPRVVYTMTHSDVSHTPESVVTEETPRRFGGDYGSRSPLPFIVSKIAASDFVGQYDRDGVVQGVVLRLANIRGYGSRDTHYNCVFHQFIQKALKGEPIEIWGDHSTRRDMIYVKDVTAAIRMALASPDAHGLYNIGSGKGLTIEDEAKAIVRAFSPSDRPSRLVYRPEIEEVRKRSCVFDISKARKDLGWEPKHTYDEAMVDYRKEMERGYFDLKR